MSGGSNIRSYAAASIATLVTCSTLLLLTIYGGKVLAQRDSTSADLKQQFLHPPDDCRIMMRWWWFGPAVTKPELKRELEQMKEAGIGGVEIATLYPLALDNPATGFRNLTFLSDEHIEAIRFAADEARKLGLRIDITLGSGWPFGGRHIPITQAAGAMRIEKAVIAAGVKSISVPNIGSGEKLAAVFIAPGSTDPADFKNARQLESPDIQNGRLQLPGQINAPQTAIFFISSRTGMMVKRPAAGAEGFVLDHYDQSAIETHLHSVGNRLLEAFGDHPPYAVFSDSLEDYGSDWTSNLLEGFRQRRGYDLTPHLPALVADIGPESAAVRHDWGKTLTELTNEHFLMPLHAWAQQHHTLLRSQTYGFPPVTLSSNRYEDLPEGEGKATMLMWRQFSDTRWAASAGHLFEKPVISSETWTWLHSPAFRATPLDMKAEADLHFLQGINQLVGHGWPYSPESAGEPGWRMYAAGAFNAHSPWFFAMPDLAAYLQRVSFALRQGEPANDVALLLPNDDAWASFTVASDSNSAVTTKTGFNTRGENISIDETMPKLLGDIVIGAIVDAGFNVDFIDADAIDSLGVSYPVLVLPSVERLPLATYRKIEDYAKGGGIVIATRRLPSTAPGFTNADAESREIREISQRLFQSNTATGHFVEDDGQLGESIAKYLTPDIRFSPKTPQVGFIHRSLPNGDLYFVANTDNRSVRVKANFRQKRKFAERWDPFSGRTSPMQGPENIVLSLGAYESCLIFFTDSAPNESVGKVPEPAHSSNLQPVSIDLSTKWKLSFKGTNQVGEMTTLHSWSDDEQSRYFSGQVVFEKQFDLSPDEIKGRALFLDFGEGKPVSKPDPLPRFNLWAFLESPIREAAEVYVNEQRVGVVWHPPYKVEVTRFLHTGNNKLRIVVGNTAINSLSASSPPNYRLLNDRYGERFVPQDMDHLQPLPSGLLSGVWLRTMDEDQQ